MSKKIFYNKIKIFDIEIDNITLDELFLRIDEMIINNKKGYIVTPNVDSIVQLNSNLELKNIYNNATLILNDSMILKRAGAILGYKMREKLSGSDLLPLICEYSSKKNYSLFFLGAKDGVAEMAANNLKNKFSNLNIVGTYPPPFGFENDIVECNKIVTMINNYSPQILFIGLGAPKQEKFAYKYLKDLNVNIILCTGAAFDFQAGNVKRAPKFIRRIGMEWFYRFYKEPRRLFRRYFIEDMKFFKLFMVELKNQKKS